MLPSGYYRGCYSGNSLQWSYNDRDGVSNHRRPDCLLNRVLRSRSRKTSKLRVTGPCDANSRLPVEFHTRGKCFHLMTSSFYHFIQVTATHLKIRGQVEEMGVAVTWTMCEDIPKVVPIMATGLIYPIHPQFPRSGISWWRHQMEMFSALLAICAGNSPVTGEFPGQRQVTRSLDVLFDMRLNKRLSKQSWGWWFETPSHPLWRHCNVL